MPRVIDFSRSAKFGSVDPMWRDDGNAHDITSCQIVETGFGRPSAFRKGARRQVDCSREPKRDHLRPCTKTALTKVNRATPGRGRASGKMRRVSIFSRSDKGANATVPSVCSRIGWRLSSLSTDPDFVGEVRDVVGLYVAPPEFAIVLCVDERSQIQALDRSQLIRPMRPGQSARSSCDYNPHGTTSLFAALDIATGRVIGKFFDEIEAAVPADPDVHLVMDNPQDTADPN
jgi:hypothetical protein